MKTFEEVFIENILYQFTDQESFKRVILQDIPAFVQDKIYRHILATRNTKAPVFLFTNIERNSTPNIITAISKEEILAARNDYNISQIAIISSIILDRSNESSVTVLNDLPKDKWRWISTSFGKSFIDALIANGIPEDKKDIIAQLLLVIGRKYDNGITRQWEMIVRLFEVFDNKSLQDNEVLTYALGIPNAGLNKELEHSLSVLEPAVKVKEKSKKTIVSEIERLGLFDFKQHVLESIDFIAENTNTQEYLGLVTELEILGIDVSQPGEFSRIFTVAFSDFFSKLTNKSIKPLEICNSPIFYYNSQASVKAPPDKWWKYLTSNFWSFVLEDNKSSTQDIQVRVMNVEGLFNDKIKNLTLTSSTNKGLVDFQVNNFSSFEQLNVKVGRNAQVKIESDNFSYPITDYIDKPQSFSFIAEDSKKITFKVLPIDRFSCGILPFLSGKEAISYLPYKKDGKWICELEITTRGQNKIILLVEDNVILADTYIEDVEDGNQIAFQPNNEIQIPGIIPYECFFWVEGDITEKSYKIKYTDPLGNKQELEIRFSVVKEQQDDVNSVYRRLVREHLTKKRSNVSVVFKDDFIDLFEGWIINNAEISHRPVYISVDQVERESNSNLDISENGWHSLVKGINAKKFLMRDYNPSPALVKARFDIFEFIKRNIRGPLEFQTPLRNIDFVQLGPDYEKLVITYLSEYEAALSNDDSETMLFDIHPIVYDKGISTDVISSKDIIGLLVSPYHPLRLFWQLRAQQELVKSLEKDDNYRYNPAASALDPSIVPDLISLKLRSTVGETIENRFVSLVNDSEYWGILMKGDGQSPSLNFSERLDYFWTKLGVRIEGLNQGLFPSQIERSLKDVSKLMVSKDKLKITLQGNSKGYEEEGIFNWLKKLNFTSTENVDSAYIQEHVWGTVRERNIEVYDMRPPHAQPDDYLLLDEYTQVNQNVKWFDAHIHKQKGLITDLSIICNLGLSSIEMASSQEEASPAIGPLLYKHRLVKVIDEGTQVPLKEQRKTNCSQVGDSPEFSFMRAIDILEGGATNTITSIALSPSIDLLSKALDGSNLSVVSSSLVSPATFALLSRRDSTSELYLWDFDLPSFNNTSNTKNGYYLLAHPKHGTETSAIKSSFSKYLELFNSFRALTPSQKADTCHSLLSEYILKGLPSLKKLIYGGNAFRGEIGNIIAIRLLQGEAGNGGIIPILPDNFTLNLVVPVDPFQDIIEKMPKEKDDNRSRPDLLIISYRKCQNISQIKLTPVEIKFRTQHISNWSDDITQATQFSKFLSKIFSLGSESVLWKIAFASIVGRMTEYGLNLSAFQAKKNGAFDHVYRLGFSLLNDIFNPSANTVISFDPHGRLIYINAGANTETLEFKQEISNYKIYLNNLEAEKILFQANGGYDLIQTNEHLKRGWDLTLDCPQDPVTPVIKEESKIIANTQTAVPVIFKTEQKPLKTINVTESIIRTTTSFNLQEYLDRYKLGLNVKVGIVKNNVGEKEYFYNPGSTNTTQLNIGVIGDLGTGKTQFLKNLVYSISIEPESNRGKSPKFLILDTKRDYDGTGSDLDRVFLNKIGAEVLIPYKLKFNLFDIQNSTEINPALMRANFFIDVLTKIYGGIGPIQKDQLLEAIMDAYKNRGYEAGQKYDNFVSPTLADIKNEYQSRITQTDAPLSIIKRLVLEELFEEDPTKTISFNKLFDKSLVVALGKISSSSDSLKLMMVIFLKLYQDYMLSIEKASYVGTSPSLRKVDSFILIDEAKLIMDYNFPVLEDLLRKGREFGVGVILSTQYLSDFTSGKIDYKEPLSTWFIHKVPNISVKELKSIGIIDSSESMVAQIQMMQKHFCLYKSADIPGKVIRAIPLYERLQLG